MLSAAACTGGGGSTTTATGRSLPTPSASAPTASAQNKAQTKVQNKVRNKQLACGAFRDTLLRLPDPGAVGGHRTVWVHRPVGPDNAQLPVLYLLHGYPGSAAQVAHSSLGALLDRLMCRTGQAAVLVAPDGNDTGHDDTEWSDDAHGRFDIESFLTGPLIAAVEGSHRRSARLRAVGGWSMGGFGAAALALRKPELYSQVATFGGYFRVDDPDDAFGMTDDAHSPDQLLDNARTLRFFLTEGTQDYERLQDGTIHGEADRFAALLRPVAAKVTVIHPSGGHDMSTWDQAFPAMLSFLDAGWDSSSARPAGWSGAPPGAASGSASAAPGARPGA